MIEKIGYIKNPLTIIAIFAGIAEVSGTVILPFITQDNQRVFVLFLMTFPIILIISFFVTLNFNHKVLYAPSDFANEDNFLKISKYDASKQENVSIRYLKDEFLQIFADQNKEIIEDINSKILKIEKLLIKSEVKSEVSLKSKSALFSYKVSKFRNSRDFLSYMSEKGYSVEIYTSPNIEENSAPYDNLKAHKSIWLGIDIPLEIAKEVIIDAKKFFPHLRYISINKAPMPDSIYIGGSTDTAINRYGCRPLTDRDFNEISSLNSSQELHEFINTFSSNDYFATRTANVS